MKKRHWFYTIIICLLLNSQQATICQSGEKMEPFKVIEEIDVRVPMRDGVRLSTNIYRPDAPGEFPVLLMRWCR
jgi:predicted acyl esterase